MNDVTIAKQQKWKEIIESWQSSGKAMRIWCKEHGIAYNTFLYWRNQFRSQKVSESISPVSSPSFVELPEEKPSHSGIQILIKDIKLDVSPDFEEAALVRCVRLLRSL